MKKLFILLAIMASTHLVSAQKKMVTIGGKQLEVTGKKGHVSGDPKAFQIANYYGIVGDKAVFYELTTMKNKLVKYERSTFPIAQLNKSMFEPLKTSAGKNNSFYTLQIFYQRFGDSKKYGQIFTVDTRYGKIKSYTQSTSNIITSISKKEELDAFIKEVKKKMVALK